MKDKIFILAIVMAALFPFPASSASVRSHLERDAESYAVSKCLTLQANSFLKTEGYKWGSVIMERSQAGYEDWLPISESVEKEIRNTPVWSIHVDKTVNESTETATLGYCGEIIDAYAVRKAIDMTIVKLTPKYKTRRGD